VLYWNSYVILVCWRRFESENSAIQSDINLVISLKGKLFHSFVRSFVHYNFIKFYSFYYLIRYQPLVGKKAAHFSTSLEQCCFILSRLDNSYKSMYQIGTTKIFLRESLDQYLEHQKLLIIHRSAVVIQKWARMYITQLKYIKLKESTILIQSYVRRWIQRYLFFFVFVL
jgi:myosin heavy subunit